MQNNLKKINNNSENISTFNKEKSYISNTTNNISTTSGNNGINIQNYNNEFSNVENLNLEELHFFLVGITQNYKLFESDF